MGTRVDSWGTFALLVLSCAGAPGTAGAQDSVRWVVLSAGVEADAARLRQWTERVEHELRNGGFQVILGDAVAADVRDRLSSSFEPAPAELERDLTAAVEPAVYSGAEGNSSAVYSRVEPLLTRAEPALAGLNRSTQAFTDLGNLCYVAVRSRLYDRNAAGAREQALHCMRLAPGFVPGSNLHPPDVRRLHEELRLEVEHGNAASLTVQVPEGNRTACRVGLNGRTVGRTPTLRLFVPPGDYAVDLTCGEEALPRRVHRVRAERETPTRIVIDPLLDTALGADGRSLLYPASSGVPETETLHAHARAIGDAVEAGAILVVIVSEGGVEIQRVPTSVRARLPADASASNLGQALEALAEGRSYGGELPASQGSRDARPGRRRPIVGPVLLGVVGLAGLGVLVGGALSTGCVRRAADGFCEREDRLSPLAAGLYGAGAGAALLGAVLWFTLGGRDEPSTQVGLGPTRLELEVTF